ncbi:hypothetical protein, partial [Bacteroides heparinolyticus]
TKRVFVCYFILFLMFWQTSDFGECLTENDTQVYILKASFESAFVLFFHFYPSDKLCCPFCMKTEKYLENKSQKRLETEFKQVSKNKLCFFLKAGGLLFRSRNLLFLLGG